jgi:hypothetical protein
MIAESLRSSLPPCTLCGAESRYANDLANYCEACKALVSGEFTIERTALLLLRSRIVSGSVPPLHDFLLIIDAALGQTPSGAAPDASGGPGRVYVSHWSKDGRFYGAYLEPPPWADPETAAGKVMRDAIQTRAFVPEGDMARLVLIAKAARHAANELGRTGWQRGNTEAAFEALLAALREAGR